MSDENVKSANDNPNQDNNTQQQVPPIVINTQYIKDFSLEIPHAPEVFRNLNQAPAVNIHVDVNASHMHENFFNVELSIAMDGDLIDEKLFILELKYAGIVSLNVPKEHVEPILLVEIPRMLFPFARSIITNALVDGGLPPFMLNPIDFVAMYQNRQAQQAQRPAAQPEPANKPE